MKKRIVLVVASVIIVLLVAAVFGWQNMTASAATANRVQTVAVQRGALVATVNAAGNVSAPQAVALTFQTTGRVAAVNVQVGDTVKQGQVLLTLETADLDLAVRTAQANLDSAQANLDSAKAKNAANPQQALAAKAAVDKADAAARQAQAAYDRIGGASNPSISMTSQALTLQQATDDYNSALANFKVTTASIDDTALRTAQAQLDAAHVAFEQAQNNLAKTKLVAPFDGVVATVNYSAGDTVGTNAAVNIVNLSNLQIQVTVAEVDLPKIKIGESAQVTLDALPGKTYTGQVTKLSPVGTITQGVVNYPVTVAIMNADGAVVPGMTANLAVTVDQRDNVLLLPLRAIRTTGTQKAVTVLFKGQAIQTSVNTGLSNDQSVEITSGLQEGDLVEVNQTQTRTGTIPGGGGNFLIGGGR